MPIPLPSRTPAGPHRRSVLTGALALGAAFSAPLLTACSDDGAPARKQADSATAKLRDRAVRDSAALLARYDATLEAHPALAGRLRPLRAEVDRHTQAFATPRPARTPSGTSGGASASAGSAPESPAIPAERAEALAALAEAEQRLADSRATVLLHASPDLARLLASVAAAGAAHVYLLKEGG